MAIDPLTGLPSSNNPVASTSTGYVPSTISTATMTPVTQVPVPAATPVPTSTYTAPITNTADTLTALQQEAKDRQTAVDQANAKSSEYAGLIATAQGQNVKDVAGTYASQGVNTAYNQLQDLAAQATGLKNEAAAIPIQNAIAYRGNAGVSSGVETVNRDQLAQNALKALSLGQQYAIAEGNYNKAKSIADQMIDTKFAAEEARIKSLQTQQAAYDKYTLTPAEQKRLDAVKKATDAEALQLAEKKAMDKDMQSLALTVAKNGGSQQVQQAIKNAKSFNDAVIAATPFLQSPNDKADLSYKLAQTAKIYADIRNDAMTVGSNVAPENMLPYAQEYAATGKVPVGAPKGTQSAIMKYAKELPQEPGSIVSSVTGVANASLGVEEKKDISRLYNITQSIKELKKLDDARWGGVIAGTAGKVFGSDAQAKYLTARKAIVDDISRMQSGAALTKDEVAFYEDYLPSRFSETAGLGQDSSKKIANFETVMNQKLNNALNNNQLSIYGYSTVKAPNGQEYKVGDLIQSNGVTGRVNPDGTITIVQ